MWFFLAVPLFCLNFAAQTTKGYYGKGNSAFIGSAFQQFS